MIIRTLPSALWHFPATSLLASVVAGCPCGPPVGCLDAIHVVLTRDAGFGGGALEIHVETPSRTFDCTLGAPGAPCNLQADVQGGLDMMIPIAADDPSSGVFALRVVEASDDGASELVIFDDASIPYSLGANQPNGPYCDPTCRGADLALTAQH